MKYILAISGGIDSVALLDMVMNDKLTDIDKNNIVVAHFDHGIRKNSSKDADFVRNLAKKHNLEFYYERENLGTDSSEELARKRRYEFLRRVAKNVGEDSKIVTAHHQDDLIETMLINLLRGTGWRGIAPFWSNDILRPLMNMTKAEIIDYAIQNNLNWVEDETNYGHKNFRNRVRNVSQAMAADRRQQLLDIYENQRRIRSGIEEILEDVNYKDNLRISEILDLPKNVAIEILGVAAGNKLTIPQIERFLEYLGDAKSGDLYQPGGNLQVAIYQDSITVYERD